MIERKFFTYEKWYLGNTPDRLGWTITFRFCSSFKIEFKYQQQYKKSIK